jgi:hypothetical protein
MKTQAGGRIGWEPKRERLAILEDQAKLPDAGAEVYRVGARLRFKIQGFPLLTNQAEIANERRTAQVSLQAGLDRRQPFSQLDV